MKSEKPRVSPFLLGSIGLALTLTLSACGGASGTSGGGSAEFEEAKLTMHIGSPPAHPQGVALQAFVEEVSEKTNGKVTIEPFFSGSLLAGNQDLPGIGDGVADLGHVFTTYHREALPVLNWFSDLQSLRSDAIPQGLLQASAALQRKWTQSEAIQKEADGHNVVILGGSTNGTNYGLLCTKPINSLEEGKGRLVRVGGATWSAEMKALGFSPVSLSSGEIYEGLQRGVVDCTLADPNTVSGLKLYEIAKFYHPISGSGTSSTLLVINKDTWASLSDGVKDVLRAATDNYAAAVLEGGLDGYKQFAENLGKWGMTIVDPRPLNTVLHAYQREQIKKVVGAAPPAVANPEEFLKTWEADLKWGMEIAIENVGAKPDESGSPKSIIDGYLSGADAVDMPKFLEAVRSGP